MFNEQERELLKEHLSLRRLSLCTCHVCSASFCFGRFRNARSSRKKSHREMKLRDERPKIWPSAPILARCLREDRDSRNDEWCHQNQVNQPEVHFPDPPLPKSATAGTHFMGFSDEHGSTCALQRAVASTKIKKSYEAEATELRSSCRRQKCEKATVPWRARLFVQTVACRCADLP